jgi:hypothetical protein
MSHEWIYRTRHNRIDIVVQLNLFRDAGVQISPYSMGWMVRVLFPAVQAPYFLHSVRTDTGKPCVNVNLHGR